ERERDKDKREATSAQPHDDKGITGTYIDGRYLIRRLIGEGGMGLVYEAEHVEIGRRVAVKVLHAMYTRQNEVVARFRSEARAATRIGHPHIIDVFDSGTTVDGAVYFVMEFLEGRDLSQTLEDEGPMMPQRAMLIAREICMALMAAHKANILHRDLKPENVFLILRDGNPDFVKVLDFGIAKTMEGLSERVGRLTSPGVAMGTPEYMAPEQAAGQQIDARADVYAIGAILYEMLSGRPPHEGQNIMEVLTRKATVAPTPLEVSRPDVPRDLQHLVMRTLAISPDLRPQSMEAMAHELTKLVGPAPSLSQPFLASERVPRKKTPYVAAAIAAAMLLGGAGMLVFTRTTTSSATAQPLPSRQAATGGVRANASAPVATPLLPTATPLLPTVTPLAPTLAVAAPTAPATAAAVAIAASVPASSKVITVEKPLVVKPPLDPPKSTAPSPGMALAEARRMLQKAHEACTSERYAEAEELYNRVRASGLERGPSLTGLAEVAFQQEHYPEAVRLGHRAIESGGGVAARMVLGNSYFKLGKYDDAIGEYRGVLKIDNGHAEARENLAAAERRKGG
ncbi:MAG TPA: serine/threonine-protein kinase, partial [Polyangia bacterium]|nr:serine/threonine-protein kinase [Polyangia bacterium]